MLCVHNAPKFSWNSLSSNTDLQISFTIQVHSFCPSTFLTIVISSTKPIVLHPILWIDKREAFSGVCPKFFGQFLALSFDCQRGEDQQMFSAEVFTACNTSSHNKAVLCLHLRWKSRLQSKRPTSHRSKWQDVLAPPSRKFTSLIWSQPKSPPEQNTPLREGGAALALTDFLGFTHNVNLPQQGGDMRSFHKYSNISRQPWKHEPLFTLERMTGSSCAQQQTALEEENGAVLPICYYGNNSWRGIKWIISAKSNWEVSDAAAGHWLLTVYDIIRLPDEFAVW